MSKPASAGQGPERKGGAPRSAETQAAALRRTRLEHATETAQDYVEAIADLATMHGEARAVDLAGRLGVTHVTVIRTIARLQRDGYVLTRPYRSIFLTDKGSRLADESRRRHEIVVSFLRRLGVPENVAQIDAEGIEHHVSAETLAALRRYTESRE
ncbi:MAG TPA: manganese-binding transcriptional regulator MntR [Verrucomicrobiae bacterium]|jgi:DtxR family manganese transport transcriptional regulator|nr:manganese-binding transcriptional regulator MntR [Verrucomicrobiae bacterium]